LVALHLIVVGRSPRYDVVLSFILPDR
jgi:hypothetical protein